MAFGDYQLEIYLQGLSGIVPSFPMSFAEWEAKAQAAMPPSIWSYVTGGAGDERTQRVNRTAFDNWGLTSIFRAAGFGGFWGGWGRCWLACGA